MPGDCRTLTVRDTYAEMFDVGTILWRATKQISDVAHLEEVKFERTTRETFIARMHFLKPSAGWEPHVYSVSGRRGPNKGIVVFCNEEPHKDWTHLVVTGCSSRMKETIGPDGRIDGGMCVFAEEVEPYDIDDYLEFRAKLARIRRDNFKSPFDKIVSLCSRIWPDGECSDKYHRLLVEQSYDKREPMPLYDYAHIVKS